MHYHNSIAKQLFLCVLVRLDGEVNEDLDKVTQCLAREAASTQEGLTISPLVNTDRKGGAYSIMLQQFWRAIAVTAANRHSQHTLNRLHYVRGTEQEARDACRSHHSDNRWRPHQRGGYSWFNSHISEGYTMFEQFPHSIMDTKFWTIPIISQIIFHIYVETNLEDIHTIRVTTGGDHTSVKDSWFNSHVSEGYAMFEQFHNGYYYSFGGTPKARQPLLLSLSVSLSRSHVHTSGTNPAICLLGFLVITLTVNPLNIFSR